MPSFTATAATTRIHGRSVISSGTHHYVSDEPTFLGGPGEAPGPHEYFLAAVAGCASNLLESVGRAEGTPPDSVDAEVVGTIDPQRAPRDDVNMFAHIAITLTLTGLDDEQAAALVDTYKARCPLYGTLVASLPVDVTCHAKSA